MGRVKAYYQEQIEQEERQDTDLALFRMMVESTQHNRRPLTVDEINYLAEQAAREDKLSKTY